MGWYSATCSPDRPEQQDAIWQLFSGVVEAVRQGADRFRFRAAPRNLVIEQLLAHYSQEGILMPYTLEDFVKEYTKEHLHLLAPKERLEGLAPKERLEGLTPAQRDDLLQELLQQRQTPSKKPKRRDD